MTVAELIELLRRLPQELPVYVADWQSGDGETRLWDGMSPREQPADGRGVGYPHRVTLG